MSRFLLISIIGILMSITMLSCSSDSSSNPSSTQSSNDLVGNWRHAVWAQQVSGTSNYTVSAFSADSAYLRIDSSGYYVYEHKTNGVITLRMAGHGHYNPPTLHMTVDTVYQSGASPDTFRVGDSQEQTITLSNSNGVMIAASRSSTNLITYSAYTRMGSDVKIAGVCADYNENAMTRRIGVSGVTVRCLNAAEVVLQTTTTNSWGFFAFTGLTPQTLRPSGWIEVGGVGAAYDNNPLPITTNGGYAVMLER